MPRNDKKNNKLNIYRLVIRFDELLLGPNANFSQIEKINFANYHDIQPAKCGTKTTTWSVINLFNISNLCLCRHDGLRGGRRRRICWQRECTQGFDKLLCVLCLHPAYNNISNGSDNYNCVGKKVWNKVGSKKLLELLISEEKRKGRRTIGEDTRRLL